MALPNARFRRLLIACLAMALLLVTLSKRRFTRKRLRQTRRPVHSIGGIPERAIVVAKTRRDNVKWAMSLKPDWQPYIYTTSTPPEPGYLVPPARDGRESIPYLSFIIDHYDSLPNYTAFVHSPQNKQHTEILDPPIAHILKNLRLDTLLAQGFVSLRCSHEPGYPLAVTPVDPTPTAVDTADARARFAAIYMQLFAVPEAAVPTQIATPCCSQFAVTRERIRARSREDYIRMRNWALHEHQHAHASATYADADATSATATATDSSGVDWVFARVWHIVFGMPATHCPTADAYCCDVFGWCPGDTIPAAVETAGKRAHPWLGRSRLWRPGG